MASEDTIHRHKRKRALDVNYGMKLKKPMHGFSGLGNTGDPRSPNKTDVIIPVGMKMRQKLQDALNEKVFSDLFVPKS